MGDECAEASTGLGPRVPGSTVYSVPSVCTQEESDDEVSEYETSDSETEHKLETEHALETEIITDFNFDDAVNLF